MTRVNRTLAVLELFQDDPRPLSVEQMALRLSLPVSTLYRSIRDLAAGGYLDSIGGAGYALGPAFIRYDQTLRRNDQLITLADPVMRKLLTSTSQNAVSILCRRFRDCVMCVHQVHGRKPHEAPRYERGVAMPMFRGATSKAILANLDMRMLKNVYLKNEAEIHRAMAVTDWPSFRAEMRELKKAGWVITASEIAKGRVGIAAPIQRSGQVVGSLSLILTPNATERRRLNEYGALVANAADLISDQQGQPARRRGG
jgi:DNA-binding IclR family transcriptional regulator